MPTVWGYVRASTNEQRDTLDAQRNTLQREFAHRFEADGYTLEILTDAGVSGNRPLAQRPQGKQILARAKQGDVVLISKLDRGFRNMRDLVERMEEWEAKGVRLVLLDLAMDTGTPTGKFMCHVLGAVAEFERARLRERMRDVREDRLRRGLPATSQAPYGWKFVREPLPKKGKRLVRDPYTRSVAVKIIEWREQGWNYEEIYWHLVREHVQTREGKPWSYKAIQRAYQRELDLQATEKLRANGEQP